MCGFIVAYVGGLTGCFINGFVIGGLFGDFVYSLVNAIMGWGCQRLHHWFCIWPHVWFCWCFRQWPCGC